MERLTVLPQLDLRVRNTRESFGQKKNDYLSEITQREPFLVGEKIVSILDLDGVLCEYGQRNNFDCNVSRLLNLKKIISKSDEFIFYSSRIEMNEDSKIWDFLKPLFGDTIIAKCPFITKSSENRLKSFAEKVNPDCLIQFKVGFKKMRSCFGLDDNLFDMVEKSLEQNKKIVMIGSSIFDRKIVKQIVENTKEKGLNTKNIYSFNTGHWFV